MSSVSMATPAARVANTNTLQRGIASGITVFNFMVRVSTDNSLMLMEEVDPTPSWSTTKYKAHALII